MRQGRHDAGRERESGEDWREGMEEGGGDQIFFEFHRFSETLTFPLFLKIPYLTLLHIFSDLKSCHKLNLFALCVCVFFMAGGCGGNMCGHISAAAAVAVRIDAADLCRSEWSRGLRAAAAGCRRRQECQEQGACACGCGVSCGG